MNCREFNKNMKVFGRKSPMLMIFSIFNCGQQRYSCPWNGVILWIKWAMLHPSLTMEQNTT